MCAAGFTDLYLGAMDAIWGMTPGAPIFVVEGAGQGAYAGLNWVGGHDNDSCTLPLRTSHLALAQLQHQACNAPPSPDAFKGWRNVC